RLDRDRPGAPPARPPPRPAGGGVRFRRRRPLPEPVIFYVVTGLLVVLVLGLATAVPGAG
ncbi:MAG: hypothetical protein ACRDQH_15530, partial [Pseudonocardiaceae bacterium]